MFNGVTKLEWIDVSEALPLDEYRDPSQIVAEVLVLVADLSDSNSDVTVVSLMYDTDLKWHFVDGKPYHSADRIVYWCYEPCITTMEILEYKNE